MARMFPQRISTDAPMSERNVFEALAELPDEWLVFHSVAWQGVRHGRQGDGEADFVVAHPRRGVLVVEVKGGDISIEDGSWYSRSRGGERHEIRNPFDQAVDSKYALRDYLEDRIPHLGSTLRMGHVVAFPAVEITAGLGSDAPRAIIWDRYDLRDIGRAAGRAAGHWEGLTRFDDHQFAEFRKALAPTTQVKKRLRHQVEDVVDDLVDLTEQQTNLLVFLRRQRRAFITGAAGTGKTALAIERARQLAEENRHVLLLCHSRLLGEKLTRDLADLDGVVAGSFHQVVYDIVDRAGRLPDGERDDDWWSVRLPEQLPDAAADLGITFDAVVVDEGQDFHPMWWTALGLLIPDSDAAFLYVFADSHRDLYRPDWSPPFPADPLVLDVRCRNTVQIGNHVNALFPTGEASLGADGPSPGFIVAGNVDAVRRTLDRVIGGLLAEQQFRPQQIAVLSTGAELIEQLTGHQVHGHALAGVGAGGITLETVDRFKGLEADVVVLLIDEADSPQGRARAYVGMSRARVLLLVIGPAPVKASLGWS